MISTKTKVLILTDWFTPGFKAGGPIQSVSRLVHQLKENLSISVITRDRDLSETRKYPEVNSDVWTTSDGYQVMYCSLKNEDNLIRKELFTGDFDKVYLNSFFSLKYTLIPLYHLWKYGRLDKVIIAPRGMLGEGALAIKSTKKAWMIRLFKWIQLHSKVKFHSTDISETSSIQKVLGNNSRITEVQNFPIQPTAKPLLSKNAQTQFIFASRISPKKNLATILPIFKELNLALKVIGLEDDAAYGSKCRAFKSSTISFLGPQEPEDLYETFRESDFLILPTMNENFGHAIIEALAHGCPVIISDQTPWNDLEEFGAGWVIPLLDIQRWKAVIQEANAMDRASYMRMSEKAVEYCQSKFNFSEIRQAYLELFDAKD